MYILYNTKFSLFSLQFFYYEKNNQSLHVFFIAILCLTLFSCQQEETNGELSDKNEVLTIENSENFVDQNKASKIASDFVFDVQNKNTKDITYLKKEISEISPIPDEANNTVFYIVNYKNGGFVILAADNRSIPILAYSDSETFDLGANSYPSGLVEWLSDTKESIKYLRDNKLKQSPKTKKAWEDVNLFNRSEPPGGGCENEFEQVDRLLSTKWNQGTGYNDYMPFKSCSPGLPGGRAWAGCVPVAIAQVMKYHQHPSSYNWSNMPLGPTGNTTIASLIKDIHDEINYPFPIVDYDCDATGVNTDFDTPGLFRNDFGYSTATRADYSSNTIKQELRANRPVILQGGRNANWWIFNNYDDGHMWVCDGFKSSKICIFDDNGNPIGAAYYLYYRMNWGWGGLYNNAWYANNNFNPGSDTFNFQKKMIYNIKP